MKQKPDIDDLELTSPPGPKDPRDGSAETMKIPTIKHACADMMRAYRKLQAARDHFNELVKDVAARGNANPAAIKKLLKHSAAGTFHEYRAELDKAAVLFEQIGQVPIAEDGVTLDPTETPPPDARHAH